MQHMAGRYGREIPWGQGGLVQRLVVTWTWVCPVWRPGAVLVHDFAERTVQALLNASEALYHVENHERGRVPGTVGPAAARHRP